MSEYESLVFKGLEFRLFEFKGEFYLVRELTGEERDTFLTTMKKKVDTKDPSKPVVKDHTGLNSMLLSFASEKIVSISGQSELPKTLSLLEKLVESESLQYDSFVCESIAHSVTQEWGSGMVGSLTKIAQTLSGLDKQAAEKKD